MKGEQQKSLFERLKDEHERIASQAAQAEAEAKPRREAWEKQIKADEEDEQREAGILAGMVADFESAEAQALADEQSRQAAEDTAKAGLKAGRISINGYLAGARADKERVAKARLEVRTRLDGALTAVREKAREVQALKIKVLEDRQNLAYFIAVGPMAFLEKLRSLLKATEQMIGTERAPALVWTVLRAEKERLARGQGRALSGEIWRDLDAQAVKRLRFTVDIPDDELPALQQIIEDMETRPGVLVTLRYHGMDRKPGHRLEVMTWEDGRGKRESA
jgi:hypothetical protein